MAGRNLLLRRHFKRADQRRRQQSASTISWTSDASGSESPEDCDDPTKIVDTLVPQVEEEQTVDVATHSFQA